MSSADSLAQPNTFLSPNSDFTTYSEQGDAWLCAALCFYAVSSQISMALMSIGAGLLALTLIAKKFWEHFSLLRHPLVRQYAMISAGLAASCIFSLVMAQIMPYQIAGQSADLQWGRSLAKLWYFLLPMIVLMGLLRINAPERLKVLRFWLGALALLSAIGVFQHYTGWPRMRPIPSIPGRYHATLFLGHHLSVASILIFPLFACLDFLRSKQWRAQLGIPALALGLATLLATVAIVFTFSRIAWVALPAGLTLYVLFILSGRLKIVAILILAFAAGGISQYPPVKERLHHQTGIGDRFELWEANLKFFMDRPVWGVGFKTNQERSGQYLHAKHPDRQKVFSGHAHNNLIEMIAGTGLLGTLFWLVWVAWVFKLFWQLKQSRVGFGLGWLCAWAVFHLNGLTQVNFWESKVMHQMMWVLAWAMAWVISNKETHEKTSAD